MTLTAPAWINLITAMLTAGALQVWTTGVVGMYRFVWIVTHDVFVPALMFCILMDMIAGTLYAISREEWKLKALVRGLLRKGGLFCGVMFCYMVQRLSNWQVEVPPFNMPMGIGTAAAASYIVVEGISVFRNLDLLGVPTPYFLVHVLKGWDRESQSSKHRVEGNLNAAHDLEVLADKGYIPASQGTIEVIKEELVAAPLPKPDGNKH